MDRNRYLIDARISEHQALIVVGVEDTEEPGKMEFGMTAEVRLDGNPFSDEGPKITVSQGAIGSYPASVYRVRYRVLEEAIHIAEWLEKKADPFYSLSWMWEKDPMDRPWGLVKLDNAKKEAAA